MNAFKRAILGAARRAGYAITKIENKDSAPAAPMASVPDEPEANAPSAVEAPAPGCAEPIVEADDPIVAQARAHFERVGSTSTLPPYGSRWEPQVRAMRRDIANLHDHVSALRYAQYNITFDGRPPFPDDLTAIQLREWAVENEFPHLIPTLRQMRENPLSGPASLGEFNGRTVSRVLYYHARNVLAGITYANGPRRVLEIGGGYGEIARLWLSNTRTPADSYVIVDIPESLFFAEAALRAEFGDQVGYLEERDPGTRILLVPLSRLGQLHRPADLIVNTGSMQEMTDEWIDFYMSWLDSFEARMFYCLNYAAQPISIMGESRNLWTHRPSAKWTTRHLRLGIPLMELEGPMRDYLEAVYEKTPATRSLREWSVFRGHLLSKTTFVEGLDLLRQDFTVSDAAAFADTVIEQMPYRPKELLFVVEWLGRSGAPRYTQIRDELREMRGGELFHDPAAPDGARALSGDARRVDLAR